ncbi:MAG: IS21 family transposase, partial [Clostridia bacterium]|nr:IS21 family transposase [Clostridia bacterium]
MKTTIKTLHLKGYNKTQIGRMLHIDRKTVRKVLRSEEGCKEDKQTGRGIWPSVLDKHMEYISAQIAKG